MIQFLEKYAAAIIGITLGYYIYKFCGINHELSKEFIKQYTTIGTCLFGFLLTLFSIIIQGKNVVIDKIKSNRKTFVRFVYLNKQVVIMTLLLTIYAYIIGYINIEYFISASMYKEEILNIITIAFYGGFIWTLLITIYFLIIFYFIIQGKEE